MVEQWKNLEFNQNYAISTYGKVKNNITNKILKNQIRSYCSITLNKKTYSIHRLVAIAFIPNPLNKPTVNHIDHDKTNNHYKNLEWSTYSEQAIHSPNIKPMTRRFIIQYNKDLSQVINKFDNITLASEYIKESKKSIPLITILKNISCNATNKSKSAYDYIWKYEEYEENDLEEWKEIEIKNITYFISNLGKIRNKNRLLNPNIDNNGYYAFATKTIHNLVANAFLQKENISDVVNHKDGNKLNNDINNLEFISQSQNTIHAINLGLRRNVKKVAHVNDDNIIINVYNSCSEAGKELNVNITSVNKCCKGLLQSCGDPKLKFRYVDMNNNIIIIKKENIIKKIKNIKLKINIYDKITNNLIDTCDTIVATCKKYNINNKTVSNHCDGKVQYSSLPYYFRYA